MNEVHVLVPFFFLYFLDAWQINWQNEHFACFVFILSWWQLFGGALAPRILGAGAECISRVLT